MDINFGDAAGGGGAWIPVASALGGVLIGGLITSWQQRSQRKHEAREKALDRANSLRKDVCLKATETMTAAMNALVGMGGGDMQPWNLARPAFLASLQQLQLVGSAQTVVVASEMNKALAEAVVPITQAAFVARDTRGKMEWIEANRKAARKEVDSAMKRVDAHNADPGHTTDVTLRKALQDEANRARVALYQLEGDYSASTEATRNATFAFLRVVGQHLTPIQKLTHQLLSSIREDLGHEQLSADILTKLEEHQAVLKQDFMNMANDRWPNAL